MVMHDNIRVAIIGAGLQGRRYASALKGIPGTKILIVADSDLGRAQALAAETGAQPLVDWEKAIKKPEINALLVCTPPHLHAPIAIAAMQAGKHVLCEKPLALTLEEAEEMISTARKNGVNLGCGFNYRHHPGIRQARAWFDNGDIGEMIFMRCRHGIVGRPGYEQEWRAQPGLTGGGHLMEQGIHILDLFRWFAGDFMNAAAFASTNYWDMAPLEDNAFAILQTCRGQIASLHSSLTQWRNIFSFEVYGRDGYVQVEGLGGSYGTEKAILGKRDFTRPFTEVVVDFRGPDNSFAETWRNFSNSIQEEKVFLDSAHDGFEALRLVNALYQSCKERKIVTLDAHGALSA